MSVATEGHDVPQSPQETLPTKVSCRGELLRATLLTETFKMNVSDLRGPRRTWQLCRKSSQLTEVLEETQSATMVKMTMVADAHLLSETGR